MFLMTPGKIDGMVGKYRWYMLGGALLIGLSLLMAKYGNVPAGILSGPLLLMLGAMGGALRLWKSERGLWMVSVLFLIPSLAFYGFFSYIEFSTILPFPVNLKEFLCAIDLSLATYVLWKQVRLLGSAGYYNWKLGK